MASTSQSRRPTVSDFPVGPTARTQEQLRRDRVLAIAHGEALKAGVVGTIVAGAATAFASYKSLPFAKYMSVSAKTSLPVMAGLFLYPLRYELCIGSMNRRPEQWGLTEEVISSGKVTKSTMPIHHVVLNGLYDNTFSFILCAGAPFAAYVLSQQLKLKHLTLSQRVMHSRVFAQAGILTIGLSTLAFREWMDKNGRFPEPDE